MSDIPKSERTESRLKAQHMAYQVRTRITAELMATFAYSQKRQEAHIRKMVQHVQDPEAREEMAKVIRQLPKLRRRVLLSATDAEEIPGFASVGKEYARLDYLDKTAEGKERISLHVVHSPEKDKLQTLQQKVL